MARQTRNNPDGKRQRNPIESEEDEDDYSQVSCFEKGLGDSD